MAAVSDSPLARIVDLRHLRSGDLDALLEEETETWRETLDLDFRASAGLVRRFLDMQALNGFSLLVNSHPVGYCYFVSEERKGLIGDLYVMREFATVVESLIKTPFVQRIESQLMMLRTARQMTLPQQRYLRVHVRNFMELDLATGGKLPPGKPGFSALIDSWTERKQDEAASLIATA